MELLWLFGEILLLLMAIWIVLFFCVGFLVLAYGELLNRGVKIIFREIAKNPIYLVVGFGLLNAILGFAAIAYFIVLDWF